jgi:hypothetical protein
MFEVLTLILFKKKKKNSFYWRTPVYLPQNPILEIETKKIATELTIYKLVCI